MPKALFDFAEQAMKDFGTGFTNAKETLKTTVEGIAGVITTAIGGLPGKMLEIGGNIVKGLWDGISGLTGWLADQVGGFVTGIIDKAKEGFDINSPSKEFEYIGKMCVAGYDQGMEEFADTANMTRKIKSGLTDMKNSIEGQRYTNGSYGYGDFNQTININKEVSTADEMARTIRIESKWGLMKGVPIGS